MTRLIGRLKDKRVAQLIREGKRGSHYDGQGLTLKIKSRKVSAWESRYQLNGQVRYMGLGSTKAFSLVEARERNRTLVRQKLADGVDPLAVRQAEKDAQRAAAAKAKTFHDAYLEFLKDREPVEGDAAVEANGEANGEENGEDNGNQHQWTNSKHRKQWRSTLDRYANPIIGKLPVSEIDTQLVLQVLKQPVEAGLGHRAGPLWRTRQETASRLRARIEAVLNWAKANGHRSGDNPAAEEVISKALPLGMRKVKHHAALPFVNVPAFMTELRTREGSAARALEFLILCASRSQEVIKARWSEIGDLDKAVWTVPAERMKMKREHRVPLSDAAIELLRGLPRESDDPDAFVFIGALAGKPMGHSTMERLLERMGHDVTVHGFRSSFADWASERTNYTNDIREAALAHGKPKIIATYQRGDLFEKRRRLMRDWSKYCLMPPATKKDRTGKVVHIGAGR